jgi:uncharacterized protein
MDQAEQVHPEGDEGPDRRAVTRMCIVTRAVRPVSGLIRFVAGPDGTVVPDIRARLPGRGVWVTNANTLLAQAITRKLFQRGLKENLRIPDGLVTLVGDLLRKDALQMLSLANKAGLVTSGFAKIEGMRTMLALVQASDGSEAEIARLQRMCRGKGRGHRDPSVVRVFSAEELGLSIGREHVIHAALTAQETASVFMDRASRFADFQAGGPAEQVTASACGPSGIPGSHRNEAVMDREALDREIPDQKPDE